MTFHAFLFLVASGASITRPTLSNFFFLLVHQTSFLADFPFCLFLRTFQLSQDVLVSLFSSHVQRRLPGFYIFYLRVIFLCQLLETLFCLISLLCMRFQAFTSWKKAFFCTITPLNQLNISNQQLIWAAPEPQLEDLKSGSKSASKKLPWFLQLVETVSSGCNPWCS